MKAIEKNGQTIIGVPKTWVRPATPTLTTVAYDEFPDAEHYLDGWLDIISPPYNTETQYLNTSEVDKIFQNDTLVGYKWKVVDYTPEEISNNAQTALDNDDAQQLADYRQELGRTEYRRLQAIIERKYRAGEFSANATNNKLIATGLYEYFSDALGCINWGDWVVAQKKLLVAPATANAVALALYNAVKTKVDEKVIEAYQRAAK